MTSVKNMVAGLRCERDHFPRAVSEIQPLTTEALLTVANESVHDQSAVPDKTTALDSGRVTLDARLILYLFGTPRQRRSWFMLGRPDSRSYQCCDHGRHTLAGRSFSAVDYFEAARLPFSWASTASSRTRQAMSRRPWW